MKKGFTLLEVLVSLVILSFSIVSVYQIFSLGFGNLARLHRYQDLYLAVGNLIEEINLITDFRAEKERTGKIGDFDYEWTAVPHTPEQPIPWFEDRFSPYDVALYRIDIKIFIDGERRHREFTLYKVGWSYDRS